MAVQGEGRKQDTRRKEQGWGRPPNNLKLSIKSSALGSVSSPEGGIAGSKAGSVSCGRELQSAGLPEQRKT